VKVLIRFTADVGRTEYAKLRGIDQSEVRQDIRKQVVDDFVAKCKEYGIPCEILANG
jgi:hypothetical protein